eukprot:Nitzschia sp. Nitz4//scaffold2_size372955//362198//363091//NITZ4_000481-RA/size372955-processed-gene-0.553-mRNA-1//-1//CDS//3329546952//3894//frame0
MTSWPWMKGVDLAIADPIEPVVPEDTRPSVKDLIKEHRDKIDKVKAAIEEDPLYDSTKHDDLWILRFLLSHKKSKPAIAAAKHALQFRRKYDLDSKDIRTVPFQDCDWQTVAEFRKYRCSENNVLTTLPDEHRGVVVYMKLSKMNAEAHTKMVSDDSWNKGFVYVAEWSHQHLDYITRTTGRLTRSIRFIDLEGMTLSKAMSDREGKKRSGEIVAEMEDVYPQLLEAVILCHPPEWLHIVWSMLRTIMPKRVVEKMEIMTPHKNEKERKRLLKYLSIDNLPSSYGGKETKLLQGWND